MSEIKLGQLIDPREVVERDAIHIAVAPVVATEEMTPGDSIGLVEDSLTHVERRVTGIGIVDPFLRGRVFKGDQFFMFLYPNTVTGMRHHWSHPAFVEIPPAEKRVELQKSVDWLRQFAEEIGLTYNEVIEAGATYVKDGTSFLQDGSSTAQEAFNNDRTRVEFWRHFELVTGLRLNENLLDT